MKGITEPEEKDNLVGIKRGDMDRSQNNEKSTLISFNDRLRRSLKDETAKKSNGDGSPPPSDILEREGKLSEEKAPKARNHASSPTSTSHAIVDRYVKGEIKSSTEDAQELEELLNDACNVTCETRRDDPTRRLGNIVALSDPSPLPDNGQPEAFQVPNPLDIQPLPDPTTTVEGLPGAYASAPLHYRDDPRRVAALQRSAQEQPSGSQELVRNESETNLTVAMPIDESERINLQHAKLHSDESSERTTTKSTILVGACCLAIVVVVVVVATVAVGGAEKATPNVGLDQSARDKSTIAPTSTPPLSPIQRLKQVLPTETIAKQVQEPSSPQALAYQWLLEEEENLFGLSEVRLQQRFALAALYYATNGNEKWFNNTHWLDHGVHECLWWSNEGYRSESDDTVYHQTLGNFTNPCELQNNEIPTEDTMYKHIWLFNNGLQGSVPPELLWMKSLRSFVLEDNALSGTIPPELGLATNLQVLSWASTKLAGSMPTELGKLSSTLESINFLYSGVGGPLPSQLGQLTKMTSLLLEVNEHTGTLPEELCQIQTLGDIWLAGNKMEGTIPNCLGLLPNLGDEIYLEDNLFSGTVPTTLGNPSNLKFLWIKGNLLTGPIPSQLGALPQTNTLRMEENALTGTIPSQLGSIAKLTYLDIGANVLSGSIPSELGRLPNLHKLFLHDGGLTGSIPSELGICSHMAYISLWENSLSGPIPSQLGLLEYIYDLWLDFNELTGTIPTELGLLGVNENAEYLPRVYLEHNHLRGSIPTEFGQSTLLFELSLASNEGVSGPIPTQLGNLALLKILKLDSCQLTRTIPSELGLMTSLAKLELHNNPLTGTVPEQLGLLNLTVFNITGTYITGTMPYSLCSLETLGFDCSEILCGCDCPCPATSNSTTD